MAEFAFSNHPYEQIMLRGLTISMVEFVLKNLDLIPDEDNGQVIYQAIVQRDDKDYLLRVFVNSNKVPNLVKTVYLTSKINKYQ